MTNFNNFCLTDNLKDYWTYLGSLTTPPYNESVTWVVFRDPIEISKEQVRYTLSNYFFTARQRSVLGMITG